MTDAPVQSTVEYLPDDVPESVARSAGDATCPVQPAVFPHLEVAVMTHTGLQRSANQDAFVVDSRTFSNLPEYGVHTSSTANRPVSSPFAMAWGATLAVKSPLRRLPRR